MKQHLLSSGARVMLIAMGVGMLTASCVSPRAAPTDTAPPTATAGALPVPTVPTPILTPVRRPQAANAPTLITTGQSLEDVQTISSAGFSFKPIGSFATIVRPWQAVMSDKEEKVIFSLSGSANSNGLSLENMLGLYLDAFGIEASAIRTVSPVTVDGIMGLAVDIEGYKVYNESATGRVIIVAPDSSRVFVANGFAADGPERDGWEKKGRKPFEAVIDSVRFFEPSK